MRLKFVELYGFKSFAEKTKFEFNDDFVGIVGPNGSGKSNTADAIRWVLGEQSAKALRGSKMEDVIFSGTEKKGRMNMALVTIGFDNSDHSIDLPYETVTVSRKVYRSGESDYLINNSSVRRKDVRDLFLDTGIGKEGYSIIGQGRIDDILSSRSEDRRAIFEEAAGIAKYKQRKVEAERRLVRTRESLEGVISDLKVKRKEADLLYQQAENAKKGHALTLDLERHELSLLQTQLKQLEDKKVNISSDLEKAKLDLREAQVAWDEITSKLEPYQKQIDEMDRESEENQDKLSRLTSSINSTEQEKLLRTEQLRFHEQEIKRLEADQKKLEQQKESANENLIEATEKLEELAKEKRNLDEHLEKLGETSTNLSDELKRQLQDALDDREKQRDQLHYLEYEKKTQTEADENLLAKQEELRNELSDTKATYDERLKQTQDLDVKLNEGKAKRDEYQQNIQQVGEQVKDAEDLIESLRSRLSESLNKQSSLDSQRRALSTIIDNYDGFNRSVQGLLKAADKDRTLRDKYVGVLADLIKVMSPYEDAVNVSLGGSLQNIVVETEEDAKDLIEYLKKHRLGRITFLPLNRIKGKSPTYTKEKEELINAADAIQCEERLRPLIWHLLGRTTIVDTIHDATSLARKNKGNRIVSLEGDIVNTWGSMVGGSLSNKQSFNLINRQDQLDRLLKDIEEEKQKEADLRKAGQAKVDERLALLDNLQSLVSELKGQDSELSNWENQRLSNNIHLENLKSKLDDLETELEKKAVFIPEEFEAKKEVLEQKINGLNQTIRETESELNELDSSSQERERERAVLNSKLDFNRREEQIAENTKFTIEERLEQIDFDIQSNAQSLNELQEAVKEKSDGLKNKEEKLLTYQQDIEQVKEAIEVAKRVKGEVSGLFTEQVNQKELVSKQLADLDKAIYQLEVNLDNAHNQIKQLVDNYKDQYDLSEDDVHERLNKLEAVPSTRTKVNELKQALAQIGYFNYASIDAYQELKEEVEFMNGQMEDLEKSKVDIETLIKDLDKTMELMFIDSFAKINEKYNEIFKILFEGGQAKLSLDDGDILNAGIEIEAQPPGKKLQSLDLLSGGERSMTALALLFAIFAIRPTPFCVLDEIDASLDEANIGRYVKYLQTLKDTTQFIVITHRKTTMELADMLYGITMEEGVTKVITLHFEEYMDEK